MTRITLQGCVLLALSAPTLLFAALCVPTFSRSMRYERAVGWATRTALTACFFALCAAGALYLQGGRNPLSLGLGKLLAGGGFSFDFLIDGYSLGFALLSTAICGVVSSFSFRYLHRETGFQRYFLMLAAFLLGLLLIALSGSIEVLYAGWEIIGLSSALLVAFFHDRPEPVRRGFRVFTVYRVGDVSMLLAAVLLHHWAGDGSLSRLFSGSGDLLLNLDSEQVVVIAVLLIAAAAAKSALLPFSTWLPVAMEGPTPSSAVYYGALSIHAGCFLLLRASALIHHSPVTRLLAAACGTATAAYAVLAARVQTDVKSRLCFASLVQAGIIVVEIAFGFEALAFLHIAGNACLRLLQFLSAPNILHDLHEIENAIGEHGAPGRTAPLASTLYFFSLERGFLDGLIEHGILRPLACLSDSLDALDRRTCRLFGPAEEAEAE